MTTFQTPRRFLSRLALLTGLLVAFSLPIWAQTPYEHKRCDDAVVKIVGNHFQLDNFSYREEGGLVVADECKPWPTDKSRMIAAFAYDAGNREKQILLALVDIPNKQVIAFYKTSILEDATTEVGGYSLRLDTARYALSKTTRAFALRSFTSVNRCIHDGGDADDLTLFIVSGKELRPVLFHPMMNRWNRHVIAGNPCGGHNDEDYEENYVEANIFIAVENTSTNGFADLRLSAKSDARKKPPSVVVKYNGETYDLAPWNKALDSWWESVSPWNKP
ncbi:MAG: hypothetical protein FWG81_06080 [Betaproteobacteria bacterium]|nr:hypothetical protein [Betaproteobacteria bacterium]